MLVALYSTPPFAGASNAAARATLPVGHDHHTIHKVPEGVTLPSLPTGSVCGFPTWMLGPGGVHVIVANVGCEVVFSSPVALLPVANGQQNKVTYSAKDCPNKFCCRGTSPNISIFADGKGDAVHDDVGTWPMRLVRSLLPQQRFILQHYVLVPVAGSASAAEIAAAFPIVKQAQDFWKAKAVARRGGV